MTIPSDTFNRSRDFILDSARPLDQAVFMYYFDNKNSQNVLNELKKFQNADGGFGNGIEPDFQLPNSSNMATTYAFQYFDKLELSELPVFLQKAVRYLDKGYSQDYQRWISTPVQVNDYPHAPWWNYDKTKLNDYETWGNPTVEIIGYLLRYKSTFDSNKLDELKYQAIERLRTKPQIEPHELKCFIRFGNSLDDEERVPVQSLIKKRINETVERDFSKWDEYVPKPLTFVDSPNSPYYEILKNEIEDELNYLVDELTKNPFIHPSWEWNNYAAEWEKVKKVWAGSLSVNSLITLKEFGRLD